MAVTVDHKAATGILEQAFLAVGSGTRPPANILHGIEAVMNASSVTFKYILVTGLLAKCVNESAHPRAIQVSSILTGAYDARSLCHKVVVPFEKIHGNLFGLSNEPFVSKPARHPEHDRGNPQLRNHALADVLHTVLEWANTQNYKHVFLALVHILRCGIAHSADVVPVKEAAGVNLALVEEFVNEFLREADGGARLVAVWGAFMRLLFEGGMVKVYSPSASDFYGKTVGDVEVFHEGVLASASECKQRPITAPDVIHGIKKAQGKVSQYDFVYSAGIADGHSSSIRKIVQSYARRLDVTVVDIHEHIPLLATVLNPTRRKRFGTEVVALLTEMRKFESAQEATDIWNKLSKTEG